jgi:cyanophycin synthetase
VVINADDPLCLAMRGRAGTDRHILVSHDPTNPAVGEHRRSGGQAVFLAEIDGAPWIVLCAGERQMPLMPTDAIPATRGGLLRFNQINAMFAAALAWAHDIDTDTITRALGTFDNTVEQAPGRYNFIEDLPFQLLVDFAHNPDGVREICRIVMQLPVTGRRILCTIDLGNHHPAHFEAVAPLLALTFDEFVLGRDYDGPDPVEAFLATNRQFLLNDGVPPESIHCVVDPEGSRRRALSLARPGDLLVILGRTKSTLPVVDEYRARAR